MTKKTQSIPTEIPKNLIVNVDQLMVMNPDGTVFVDFIGCTVDLKNNEAGRAEAENLKKVLRAIDKISNS